MKEPLTQTISFLGFVPPNSNRTFVSQRLTLPFKTKKIAASFTPGVWRLLNLQFFLSRDPEAPTLAPPQGVNILSSHGQVNFLTGDEDRKELEHEVEFSESGGYVKVYATNTDTFEHVVDAQVTIQFIEEYDNSKINKISEGDAGI